MAHRPEGRWLQRVLVGTGLLGKAEEFTVARLGGGVSADVYLVQTPQTGTRWVVKRPRRKFQVAEDWSVPTDRAQVEAAAVRLFDHRLPAGSVMPLVAQWQDEFGPVLVFQAAPREWRPWKQALLDGRVDRGVAVATGALLARIHVLGSEMDSTVLANDALFTAQRIEPYFQTSMVRVPPARPAIERLTGSFFSRSDLVHGDFSPKNLLVPPAMDRVLVIDHEVVTRGDCAFDLAFMLSHLALKGIHQSGRRALFLDCAQAFCEAYVKTGAGPRPDPGGAVQRALRWVPALLLARVVGKSPVEYLDVAARVRVVRSALRLLQDPPDGLPDLWEALPGGDASRVQKRDGQGKI